jgi:hypothetical protein
MSEHRTTPDATRDPKPDPVMEVDLATISSPALRRLVQEVRDERTGVPHVYDRIHTRHNRS